MKVAVTGAGGQLGTDLVRLLRAEGHDVLPLHTADIDFAVPQGVADAIRATAAHWVVNCAAYTAVDKAEEEPDLALRINRDSAGEVARGVAAGGGRLVHISTDFIFDGTQSRPYTEDEPANPLGAYGRSKWEGEQQVRRHLPEAVILRTAWVYAAHGRNFARTILRLAAEREQLKVVDDQVGTPSWTADIARAVLALMRAEATGTYHFTNEGVASWYDFAQAIVEEARPLGMELALRELLPIPTVDYPTPATRPAYSVLSKQKIRPLYGEPIPHWRDSLRAMLRELIEQEASIPRGQDYQQTSPLPQGRGYQQTSPLPPGEGHHQTSPLPPGEGQGEGNHA
ncbi:MAG: dTDP-4-dehydrorhamnose reductase [Gammaproteobacteria bacterium]|nr:dTDP-4-dehydrorhamnose reductase [Gammaproteobacteria bacterium]